jgi:hypothetical protein
MNIRNKYIKNARNGQKGTVWYFNLKTISTNSKEAENFTVMRDYSYLFKMCFLVVFF